MNESLHWHTIAAQKDTDARGLKQSRWLTVNCRLIFSFLSFESWPQDVEVTGDRDDSRCLHVTIHKPTMNFTHGRPLPILSARFIFDDHIRCMAAKQRLTKGRLKARQRKMQMIAYLLDLPAHLIDSLYPQAAVLQSAAALRASHPGQAVPGGSLPAQHIPGQTHLPSSSSLSKQLSVMFATVDTCRKSKLSVVGLCCSWSSSFCLVFFSRVLCCDCSVFNFLSDLQK